MTELYLQGSALALSECRLCICTLCMSVTRPSRVPRSASGIMHKSLKAVAVCAGDMISPGVQSTNMGRNESTPDLRDARYAEVAAIQNSLAHMTMPHHSHLGAYGHSTPPPNRGQRSPLLSPSGMRPVPPTFWQAYALLLITHQPCRSHWCPLHQDPRRLHICLLRMEAAGCAGSLCTAHHLARECDVGWR